MPVNSSHEISLHSVYAREAQPAVSTGHQKNFRSGHYTKLVQVSKESPFTGTNKNSPERFLNFRKKVTGTSGAMRSLSVACLKPGAVGFNATYARGQASSVCSSLARINRESMQNQHDYQWNLNRPLSFPLHRSRCHLLPRSEPPKPSGWRQLRCEGEL